MRQSQADLLEAVRVRTEAYRAGLLDAVNHRPAQRLPAGTAEAVAYAVGLDQGAELVRQRPAAADGRLVVCDVCADRDDDYLRLLAVARVQVVCTSLEAETLGLQSGSAGLNLCEIDLQAAAGGAEADRIAGQVEAALCGYGEERRDWQKDIHGE